MRYCGTEAQRPTNPPEGTTYWDVEQQRPFTFTQGEWRPGGDMSWKGEYTPQLYREGDVVRDGDWTMVANKDTTDRPAPQPAGAPEGAYPVGDPGFNPASAVVDFLATGTRFVFTEAGWASSWRVFLPAPNPDVYYRFEVVDETDPANVIRTNSDEFQSDAAGWVTVNIPERIVNVGTNLALALYAQNRAGGILHAYPWGYAGTSQVAEPAAGDWNITQQSDTIRIAYVDDGGVDRTALLNAILPGDELSFDSGLFVFRASTVTPGTDAVIITGNVLSGAPPAIGTVSTWEWFETAPQPTPYYEIPGYWAGNQPSWATVSGVFAQEPLGSARGMLGAQPLVKRPVTTLFSDAGYGVDIGFAAAVVSPDWDILANSGGGSGGGGAEAFTDLTDTPADYIGQGNKVVSVKAGEDGLEFTDPTAGVTTFDGLTDTPGTKQSLQLVRANAPATDLEYVPATPGLVGADPAGSADAVQANLTNHENDLANPHKVTAAQAGADPAGTAAAVQTNLDAHEADLANPHQVDAAQAGADPAGAADAVQANLDAHEADAANPHATTFLALPDTPSVYTGQDGKVVAVNKFENALEFIDAGGGGGGLPVYGPNVYLTDGESRTVLASEGGTTFLGSTPNTEATLNIQDIAVGEYVVVATLNPTGGTLPVVVDPGNQTLIGNGTQTGAPIRVSGPVLFAKSADGYIMAIGMESKWLGTMSKTAGTGSSVYVTTAGDDGYNLALAMNSGGTLYLSGDYPDGYRISFRNASSSRLYIATFGNHPIAYKGSYITSSSGLPIEFNETGYAYLADGIWHLHIEGGSYEERAVNNGQTVSWVTGSSMVQLGTVASIASSTTKGIGLWHIIGRINARVFTSQSVAKTCYLKARLEYGSSYVESPIVYGQARGADITWPTVSMTVDRLVQYTGTTMAMNLELWGQNVSGGPGVNWISGEIIARRP